MAENTINSVGGWRRAVGGRRRWRRGITFTEVMFAVVLLGIGFIMLAGLFAVASQQTLETVEESTGAQIAMSARQYLQRLGDDVMIDRMNGTVSPSTFWPTTTGFHQLPNELWDRVSSDAIMSQDPRFAWTALYSRRAEDQFATVIIIPLQVRNKSKFDAIGWASIPADTSRSTSVPFAYMDPKLVFINNATKGMNGVPDTVVFAVPPNAPGGDPNYLPAATGAYMVIAQGPLAGRIYRLGNYVAGLQWELVPGFDIASSTDADLLSQLNTPVYIVGKGYATMPPSDPPTYSGYAMDLGAFTTTVMIKAR